MGQISKLKNRQIAVEESTQSLFESILLLSFVKLYVKIITYYQYWQIKQLTGKKSFKVSLASKFKFFNFFDSSFCRQ
jgi:hypothetical protein